MFLSDADIRVPAPYFADPSGSSASEAPLGDEDPVQPSSLAGGDAAVGGGGSDNGASVNLPDRITALRRPGFKGDGVGLDAAAVAGAPQG